MDVFLRHTSAQDDSFLFQLYASTRVEEMTLVNWDPVQKLAFLQMQFGAQRRSYEDEFPKAQYQIILRGDDCAGRLIVDRSDERILIVDISLLPEYRSLGIGTNLIRRLQSEAKESGRTLRLHVESFNPALRLYERLGFKKIIKNGLYWQMESRDKDRVSYGEEPHSEAAGNREGV